MYAGLHLIKLERKDFATSGTPIIPLSVMVQKDRVLGFLLRFELVITQAAGATAISGAKLARVLDAIVIGERLRATGRLLDVLGWLMRGRASNAPAGVPAAAGAYRRTIELVVPLSDVSALRPLDTAPHAKMFSDETMNLTLAAVAGVFGANTTIAGQVVPYAIALPTVPTKVATPTRIGHAQFTDRLVRLPKGTLSHAVIYRDDAALISSDDVTTITVRIDGETVADALRLADFANLYNLMVAQGSQLSVASDTAPEGGEELPSEPGAAAGATDKVELPFIPVVFPGYLSAMAHLVHADSQVEVEYTGAAVGLVMGYRQLEEQSAQDVLKAGAKLGVPHLTGMRWATADGGAPGDARLARLLPKELGKV